jgi:hypothetical protein
MAGIVPSLFGPTPEDLMSLRRKEEAQTIQQAGATLGPRGAAGAAFGTALGRGANALFGLEDPEVKKATDVYAILKSTQQDLGVDAQDPEKLYGKLQENFTKAGYGDIAAKVNEQALNVVPQFKLQQMQLTEKADSIAKEKNLRADLQTLNDKAAAENREPTQAELIAVTTKYGSADKIMSVMQDASNREETRKQAVETLKLTLDNRLEVAKTQGATQTQIAQMNIDSRNMIAELIATQKQQDNINQSITNPSGVVVGKYDKSGNFRGADGTVLPAREMIGFRASHTAAMELLDKLDLLTPKDIKAAYGNAYGDVTQNRALRFASREDTIAAQTKINDVKVSETLKSLQTLKGAASDTDMRTMMSKFPGYEAPPKVMEDWVKKAKRATNKFLEKQANKYGFDSPMGTQPAVSAEQVSVGGKAYTRPANFTDDQWNAYKKSVGAE